MSFPVIALLVLLVLLFLGASYWIADLLLYGRRQPVINTPADYDMAYEEISFASQDGLLLKGWWIPSCQSESAYQQGQTIIMLHPHFGNRHGVSTQHQPWPRLWKNDLDLLPTAYTFLRAGYNVLMFDLRSHGESERGLCAGGLTEDQDVMGAVDYVFQRHQADGIATPQVGIIGFGLGAAAALAAAGREKGGANVIRVFSGDSAGGSGFLTIQPANVKRLRFIIAIQPAALSALLAGCIRQKVGPLGLVLIPLVDKICQWRGGYPLAATSLHKCVREVHVPVMYVQPRTHPYIAGDQVESLYNATPEPKQLCWIDPPGGRLEAYRYVATNMEDLLAFANQQISKS